MFAVAQKKSVFIYDNSGIELHALRNHVEPNRLAFLPFHYLLVSIGKTGYLKYQDTSTGAVVAELRTRMGECDAMAQNPRNAIINLGHKNGQVSMWTPNLSTPAVKMFTHKSPVTSVAVDATGNYLVTAGLDSQVKVWDLRTYRELHSYYSVRPASTVSISHTGMLAVGCGPHVQVWKNALATKAKSPYLVERYPGNLVRNVEFCPFEDVLGVSHATGMNSMVVPGAGEANFDSFAANPFQTSKGRQEATVHSLLEKLQPEMIMLDPSEIGGIDKADKSVLAQEKKDARAEHEASLPPEKEKHRMRGRNSSKKKWLRKRKNIIDKAKEEAKELNRKEQDNRKKQKIERIRISKGLPKPALGRFGKK